MKKIKNFKKPTKQGETIQFLMEKGFSNIKISKTLNIPKSTVSYFRKRPKELEKKGGLKITQKIQ